MSDPSTFWIIWEPFNPRTPSVRYKSRTGAYSAAREMAKRYDREFFVLKAQSSHYLKGKRVRDVTLAAWGVGAPPKCDDLVSRLKSCWLSWSRA